MSDVETTSRHISGHKNWELFALEFWHHFISLHLGFISPWIRGHFPCRESWDLWPTLQRSNFLVTNIKTLSVWRELYNPSRKATPTSGTLSSKISTTWSNVFIGFSNLSLNYTNGIEELHLWPTSQPFFLNVALNIRAVNEIQTNQWIPIQPLNTTTQDHTLPIGSDVIADGSDLWFKIPCQTCGRPHPTPETSPARGLWLSFWLNR